MQDTKQIGTKKKVPFAIIIKTLNIQNKERILKPAKQKDQVTYKSRPIRIKHDFSMETLKPRTAWTDVLQILKDHGCHPRILYPAKLSNTIDRENKIFHDKVKFKQFSHKSGLTEGTRRKPPTQEINSTHENTGNK